MENNFSIKYKGVRYSNLRPWVTNAAILIALVFTGMIPLLIGWKRK